LVYVAEFLFDQWASSQGREPARSLPARRGIMAGTFVAGELTRAREGPAGLARFAVAREADDEEIRRLLRDNRIPGRISLSLEREPDYFFDSDIPGERKQTIV